MMTHGRIKDSMIRRDRSIQSGRTTINMSRMLIDEVEMTNVQQGPKEIIKVQFKELGKPFNLQLISLATRESVKVLI